MADQHLNEGPSTSNVPGESSDSFVEINIKTLDSQIYSFQVDKNMPVSLFKEKIASDTGVPVGQQRLIFRGKVLKDDHPLSAYHVENGHTLHLVVRQPTQSQPSSDVNSGETNGNNGNQGNDVNVGGPRNRVGQISHSVLLGTFNVGDQGEGIVPDLNRVIGAVMNSLGIGGQSSTNGSNNGIQFSALSNAPGQPPQGNETEGIQGNVGSQSQAGNLSQSVQAFPGQPFPSSPQVVQIPLTAAAVPIPSLHAPIPDSLNTLSEFMNRMEQALSPNGYQPNTSSTSNEGVSRVELPSNGRGLPTPEALSIVLRQAQRLLSSHTIAALSHIAGRLEQEGASSDPTIRGQIQAESAQVGLAMQHLGSLLLELGRVVLTLRMGQSPVESSVNAGPAVYISPSGPNPIMVQPFPLQTSSLFGGSAPSSNPMSFGPVGVGNAPRHINIHIHAGTALAPVVSAVGTRTSNGDGLQGERSNNTSSADSSGSGSMRVLPVRNVIAAAVPSRPPGVSPQPGLGFSVSPQPVNSMLLSSVINEVNSQIRNFVGNMQGENQGASGEVESTVQNLSGGNNAGNDFGNEQPLSMAASGVGELSVSQPGGLSESEGQKAQPECHKVRSDEDMGSCSMEGSPSCLNGGPAVKLDDTLENALGSSEKQCLLESANAVPLGLGLGGLERKRRIKQPKAPVKSGDGRTRSAPLDQNLNSRSLGQQILRSLAPSSSVMNRTDANDPSSDKLPLAGSIMESRQLGGQANDGQHGTAGAMSQVLNSPEINGLLSGFSEQTGVGSPDGLRNMLQQLTQSPQIMNTVNQIAQQIDGQDIGNMFSGLGGGQGGGIDLSRMVQQMMPVVSQALSRGSAAQQSERRSTGVDNSYSQNFEIGIQQVAQQIELRDPPEEIFRAIVENTSLLHPNGSSPGDLVDELCSDEGLAHEYAEILRHDIHKRLQGDSGRDKC